MCCDGVSTAERKLVEALGAAWNEFVAVVPDAQTRREACAHFHALQHMVLAQSAIRDNPEWLRQPERAEAGHVL